MVFLVKHCKRSTKRDFDKRLNQYEAQDSMGASVNGSGRYVARLPSNDGNRHISIT